MGGGGLGGREKERKKRERRERMNMNGLKGLFIQASITLPGKGDKVMGLETYDWG